MTIESATGPTTGHGKRGTCGTCGTVSRVGLIVFTLLWQCFKFVKRDVRFELVGKMQYYQIQSDILIYYSTIIIRYKNSWVAGPKIPQVVQRWTFVATVTLASKSPLKLCGNRLLSFEEMDLELESMRFTICLPRSWRSSCVELYVLGSASGCSTYLQVSISNYRWSLRIVSWNAETLEM